MSSRKLWADYTDDEGSSDGETTHTSVPPGSPACLDLALPYYIKATNFPFSAKEEEIHDFLGLQGSSEETIKLLYSGGKKKKFRGIVILTITHNEIGRLAMELNGKTFQERTIACEVLQEWIQINPIPRKGKHERLRSQKQICPTSNGRKIREGF